MFTCYLIDDDSYAIEALTKYIDKVPWLSLIGSNTNPLNALAEIQSGATPDIVFLDVEMPELSGIEVAKLLPKGLAVVFTTSYKQYAFDAFQLDALDFLLKPFSFETFLKSVNKVVTRIQITKKAIEDPISRQILVKIGSTNKVVQLEKSKIIFIEALNHYVCIHTSTNKYVSHISISEIEQKLILSNFFRVHRKYIVNTDMIKSIEDG